MSNSDNKTQIGGEWKTLTDIKIKNSEGWKDIDTGYIRGVDGWEQFWVNAPSYTTPTIDSAYDNEIVSFNSYAQTSFLPTSDSNRIIIVYVFYNQSGNTCTGVKWDTGGSNEDMHLITHNTSINDNRCSMYWYSDNDEDLGTSYVVIKASFSSNCSSTMFIQQINGANQTSSPIEDYDTSYAQDEDPPSETSSITTSTNNCLLITGVTVSWDSHTIEACSGTGQTMGTDFSETGSQTTNMGWYDLSSLGTKEQCFVGDSGTARDIVLITAAIKPSGS